MMRKATLWQDWTTLLLAVWLVASPALGMAGGVALAASNSYVIGTAIGLLSLLRLLRGTEATWPEWLNVVLGGWLVLAPYFLAFPNKPTATWNHVLVGLAVGSVALWSIGEQRRLELVA